MTLDRLNATPPHTQLVRVKVENNINGVALSGACSMRSDVVLFDLQTHAGPQSHDQRPRPVSLSGSRRFRAHCTRRAGRPAAAALPAVLVFRLSEAAREQSCRTLARA